MNNTNLAIVIPTINRADLLIESIKTLHIQSDHYSRLIIIDNGDQQIEIESPKSEIVKSASNLGVAASWNFGIEMALSDPNIQYVMVVNDDVVLAGDQLERINSYLQDNCDTWLFIGPFFWSVWVISRDGVDAIKKRDNHVFDELFFPAYYEDNDFIHRFKNRFPERIQENLPELEPMVKRNGCSREKDAKLRRNMNQIYYQSKWGGAPGREARHPDDPVTLCFGYSSHCDLPSDINEHLPTLAMLSRQCSHVTEFGSGRGFATWGLLYGSPDIVVSYDVVRHTNIRLIEDAAKRENIRFDFIQANVLDTEIAATDMLFIDTLHTCKQLMRELKMHAAKVGKFMVFHDTVSFGHRDEISDGEILILRGLVPAILDFLETSEGQDWGHLHSYRNNNGLTILARLSSTGLDFQKLFGGL